MVSSISPKSAMAMARSLEIMWNDIGTVASLVAVWEKLARPAYLSK